MRVERGCMAGFRRDVERRLLTAISEWRDAAMFDDAFRWRWQGCFALYFVNRANKDDYKS